MRCDERHYNAWYGLGSIYYRQERYELAEQHFRKALSINQNSSVLYCYLGMVLHAQNNISISNEEDNDTEYNFSIEKEQEAYEILYKASQLDPKNPQLHFQLVHVLLSLDSSMELENDLQICPRNNNSLEQYNEELKIYLELHPYLYQALYELHILIELVPKEPPIYSLLGQIYHQNLNNKQLAIKYYNIAFDLDPKEYVNLKEIINNLDIPDK